MKYCPFCGFELANQKMRYCPECGSALSGKKMMQEAEPDEAEQLPPDDGYDGYYDDVVPTDDRREQEGIDKGLIKKVALLIGGTVLVIGLCVVLLVYVL